MTENNGCIFTLERIYQLNVILLDAIVGDAIEDAREIMRTKDALIAELTEQDSGNEPNPVADADETVAKLLAKISDIEQVILKNIQMKKQYYSQKKINLGKNQKFIGNYHAVQRLKKNN